MRSTCIAIAIVFATALPAGAQSVQQIGTYRDWGAYSTSSGGAAVCFAMSKATAVDPVPDGYSQGYLFITHRPSENVSNELNFVAGFDFAPDQPATLTIGGKSFDLFTQKDAAWLLDASQNDNLAGALRAGNQVVVQGATSTGIAVTESFSLSGATAASRAIDGC